MITQNQKKLLDYLIAKELIREPQVKEAEKLLETVEDKNIRLVLVNAGLIDPEKLAQAEADFWGVPYVNVLKEPIDEQILSALPFELTEKHFAVCFGKEGNRLKIALANMDDYNAREALDFWAAKKSYDLEYYLCSFNGWKDSTKKYEQFGEKVKSVLTEAEQVESLDEDVTTEKIEEVLKSAPVAKIVSMIVKHATDSKASDIHIEPFGKAGRVRFRIDGILQTVLTLPTYIYDSVIARIKVLSNLKIDETRVPQDGRFKFDAGETHFDFRVSIMPLAGREKATLRVLDTTGRTLTLEQLGFSQVVRDHVATALKQSYGMILVTGPTGSGKSTTLSSLLSTMNGEGINITTLEDPIEYYLPGINQSQVRPEVNFTFASGLRALLRQDPDVIMVGEIRDDETAEMAVHAALTGHLLFSTLHTNDAVGAIPRLTDMKVEPFLLASTLVLVIAQRLSRRICQKCKEKVEIPQDIAQKIKAELQKVKPESMPKEIDLTGTLYSYKGKGCPACKNTGYTGRVVIAESLPINDRFKIILGEGFKHEDVDNELKKIGMVTLLQDGIIKALLGITSLEEVFRVSEEVAEQQ